MLKLRIKSNLPLKFNGSNHNEAPSSDPLITISSKETVGTLKKTLIHNFQLKPNRYIRLIYSGRLLSPDDAILSSFFLVGSYHNNPYTNGNNEDTYDHEDIIRVVHCVIAPDGVKGGIQAKLSSSNTTSTAYGRDHNSLSSIRTTAGGVIDRRAGVDWNGRVSTIHSEEEEDSNDYDPTQDNNNNHAPRRGLDRLRNQGLSRSEVNALRIYFADQIHQFVMRRRNTLEEEGQEDDVRSARMNRPDRDRDDDDTYDPETALRNQRLQDEEEWMDSQGIHSELMLNIRSDATNYDVMGGTRWRSQRRSRPRLLQSAAVAMLTDMESNDQQSFTSTQLPTYPSTAVATNTTSPNTTSLLGTDRDFIWGFVLAYVCGFIMMFWVMNPTVVHRQKLGILTGLCFHTIIHLFERAQQASSSEIE